jgi:hypothetical protein
MSGIDQRFIDIINRNNLLMEKLVNVFTNHFKSTEDYNFVITVSKDKNQETKVTEDKTTQENKYSGYNKTKTLVEKAIFILTRNNKEMSYEEIKEAFLINEPELKKRWKDINRCITHILGTAYGYGAITRSRAYGCNHGPFRYGVPKDI